jgi:hypothetical protein
VKDTSLSTWSHLSMSEPVMQGQNNVIHMGDHEKLKHRILRFMSIETVLMCVCVCLN